MKRVPPCLGALLLVPLISPAQAATSSRIDAVYAAQQQQEERYHVGQATQQAQEEHVRPVDERPAFTQAAAASARERARAEALMVNKVRDHTYQDQSRSRDRRSFSKSRGPRWRTRAITLIENSRTRVPTRT